MTLYVYSRKNKQTNQATDLFSVLYGFVLVEKTTEIQETITYREKTMVHKITLEIQLWNMKKVKFKSW